MLESFLLVVFGRSSDVIHNGELRLEDEVAAANGSRPTVPSGTSRRPVRRQGFAMYEVTLGIGLPQSAMPALRYSA